MFERETRLYAMMYGLANMLADGIDDLQLATPAPGGGNTPVWILGHLAVVASYAARQMGLPPTCPEDWGKRFGPGSKPPTPEEPRPTKAELLAALAEGHRRVTEAVRNASPDELAKPHAIEFLLQTLPTRGDLLAHLMTTHEAFHLGQLSLWRRQMGLPSVLPI